MMTVRLLPSRVLESPTAPAKMPVMFRLRTHHAEICTTIRRNGAFLPRATHSLLVTKYVLLSPISLEIVKDRISIQIRREKCPHSYFTWTWKWTATVLFEQTQLTLQRQSNSSSHPAVSVSYSLYA